MRAKLTCSSRNVTSSEHLFRFSGYQDRLQHTTDHPHSLSLIPPILRSRLRLRLRADPSGPRSAAYCPRLGLFWRFASVFWTLRSGLADGWRGPNRVGGVRGCNGGWASGGDVGRTRKEKGVNGRAAELTAR